MLCKDECIISFLMKKLENPEYVLGKDPSDVSDIINIFPNKKTYELFFHINNISRVISRNFAEPQA